MKMDILLRYLLNLDMIQKIGIDVKIVGNGSLQIITYYMNNPKDNNMVIYGLVTTLDDIIPE